MADGFSTLPPEVALEQAQISRQQQLANLLMQQGMQTPQGQMISGRYVPPSIFQNLANLANIYVGQKKLEEADVQRGELAKKLREGEQKTVEEYFKAQGRPEQRTEMAGPYTGDVPPPVLTQPAVPPDFQKAMQIATNPYAPSWLKQQAVKQMEMQKLGPEETLLRPDPVTGELKPVASGLPKARAPVQVDMGTMGTMLIYPDGKREIIPKGKEPSTAKDFGNALSLRKEFNSEPIYKGYQEVKNAWNQINTGLNAKSPAGDLAAATKFMKLLDPTSVVRESELLMAMQASGALDKLYNYAQMRVAGTKLTPQQREDFRLLADEFYKTSLNQYNDKFGEYSQIAIRNNLNPMDIGKPEEFRSQAPASTSKPEQNKPPKPTGTVARAMLNGKTIVVRNGQWVDEKTGQPVQ